MHVDINGGTAKYFLEKGQVSDSYLDTHYVNFSTRELSFRIRSYTILRMAYRVKAYFCEVQLNFYKNSPAGVFVRYGSFQGVCARNGRNTR